MEPSALIPDDAIGRVGMLVTLQRIRDLPDGRLAVVRHPVGWVKEVLNADRPIFAWQVFLTGEPVVIHGQETQEIIVADNSLKPVSQLAQQDMAAMVAQHDQMVIETAVAQVRSRVAPDDIESPEFARAMHLAFSAAQLNVAKEVVGVVTVLREAGFWQAHGDDSEVFEWNTSFEGSEIRMTAAPGMFGDWEISAHAIKARSWHMPERKVLNDWPRGQILQNILELWEDVFGNRRIPRQFELGWVYRQHIRDMRLIEPALPHVVMDGDSFRRALRWLREAYRLDDVLVGPPVDLPLAIEIKDGALRLNTEDHSIGVTLQRGWVDAMRLSLRCLLTLPPHELRGPWIRMNWTGDYALINGYEICHWSD
jgi:hypothetical protein